MLTRNERHLKAIEQELAREADEIQKVWAKADEEDRETTADERGEVERKLKAIKQLEQDKKEAEDAIAVEQRVKSVSRDLGPVGSAVEVKSNGEPLDRVFQTVNKTLGEAFVTSEGYKQVKDAMSVSGGRLPQGMSTGPVSIEAKGTLMEAAGSGGGAVAATVPQVVPGVVERQFQPLSVADLLMSGQASTNSIRYVIEGTATSGAAGVAEGAAKPESTLGLTTTDEPVKKIATLLPVSEEMLEDAPAIQAYINGRLSLFVRIEEERQLLRGGGTNELVGLMGATRGINVYAGGTAAGNKAEQLFKAANGQRGSALIEPDFFVINTADWESIRLLKDTAGQYFAGGPFMNQYGNGSGMVAQSPQLFGAETIWQKPVVVTSALGAGTALVGTRSAAQVWRRGGLSVEASNSHSTYFALNLVAIRAEERLALAVYRPNAFTDVRLA